MLSQLLLERLKNPRRLNTGDEARKPELSYLSVGSADLHTTLESNLTRSKITDYTYQLPKNPFGGKCPKHLGHVHEKVLSRMYTCGTAQNNQKK